MLDSRRPKGRPQGLRRARSIKAEPSSGAAKGQGASGSTTPTEWRISPLGTTCQAPGLVWLFVAWVGVMLLCLVALYVAENGINDAVAGPKAHLLRRP